MVELRNKCGKRFSTTVFLLLMTVLLTACGDTTIVETDSQAEANMMYDILYSSQLNVEKREKSGEKAAWDIIIKEGWFGEGEAAYAIQVLNDHGLPRSNASIPATSNAYGMESPDETKKRQNREKEIQIENMIYNLPGVIRVNVIIAQPDNDVFSIDKVLPTATVSIVQTEPEPKFTINDIKILVSNTTTNLRPENVSVGVSQQLLREIPLERLREKRSRNMTLALGGGLIALLIAALGVVWYVVRRRGKMAEAEQTAENDESNQLESGEPHALNAAEDEDY